MQEVGEKMNRDKQFGQHSQHMEINYTAHCYAPMSQATLGPAMQKSAHRYLLPMARRG